MSTPQTDPQTAATLPQGKPSLKVRAIVLTLKGLLMLVAGWLLWLMPELVGKAAQPNVMRVVCIGMVFGLLWAAFGIKATAPSPATKPSQDSTSQPADDGGFPTS